MFGVALVIAGLLLSNRNNALEVLMMLDPHLKHVKGATHTANAQSGPSPHLVRAVNNRTIRKPLTCYPIIKVSFRTIRRLKRNNMA